MTSFQNKTLTFLAALLIFLSPLLMNVNAPLAEMVMQVTSVFMLLILFWSHGQKGHIPVVHWIFIILSVAFVAIYLIPIPENDWFNLPGRETYAEVIKFITAQPEGTGQQIDLRLSLIPEKTKAAVLYLIPLVAMYLVVMSLPQKSINRLIIVLLTVTTIEAALGIIQYATGSDTYYITQKHGNNADGTYANRDHYVALFELTLPILIGMLMPKYETKRKSDTMIIKKVTVITLIVLFSIAGMLSGSRAGIVNIIIGLSMVFFIFIYRTGLIRHVGILTVSAIIAVVSMFQIGITPILNRFALDPLEDGRWVMFENTKKIISDFLPLGSGPATMPEVYRAYQPIEQQNFINHAHNDYLELIADMGYLGMIIIGVFMIIFTLRWLWALSNIRTDRISNLQISAGMGALLLLLHGTVDFNFHVAANALIFILLLAIFFNKGRTNKI